MAHVEILAADGRLRGSRENERPYWLTIWGDVAPDDGSMELARVYVNDPPAALYEQAMALAMAAGKCLALAHEQDASGRWQDATTVRICESCHADFYGEDVCCPACFLAANLRQAHNALQKAAGGCTGAGCQNMPRGEDMVYCAEHTPDWHTV